MIVLWVVVAIVAIGGEVLVTNFLLLFVAFAALIAALMASVGFGIPAQLVAFAGAALMLPVLLRPHLVHRFSGKGVPSRTDPLLGTLAEVTQSIDPVLGTGRVNAGGQDWAARSTGIVAIGAQVTIAGADGIVLIVTPVADAIRPST